MSLLAELRARRPLVGTFVGTGDPVLAELLAGAFDVLVLDLEHAALGPAEMQVATIAAQGAGARVLVRVPGPDSPLLGPALDAGADGVVVPRIETVAAARQAAAALSYPPDGTRGFGPRRANRHGREAGYRHEARDRVACVVQIESEAGVAAAAEIAAVPGVDALLAGPADLSFDLGAPLELFTPAMRAALAEVQAAAAAAGIACAFASNVAPARLRELVDARTSLLLQGTDLRLFAAAADAAAAGAREALTTLDPLEDAAVT